MNRLDLRKEKFRYLSIFILSSLIATLVILLGVHVFVTAQGTGQAKIIVKLDTSKVAAYTSGKYVPHRKYDDGSVTNPFPITNETFNQSWEFFCCEKGIPYGKLNPDRVIGKDNASHYEHPDKINKGYTITKGGTDPNRRTKRDGDIPSNTSDIEYYCDASGALKTGGLYKTRKHDNIYKDQVYIPKDFVDGVYTNYVYLKREYNFDCESGLVYGEGSGTFRHTPGVNVSHAGFAFVLAVLQNRGSRAPGATYRTDPIQWLEWAWCGDLSDGGAYQSIADKFYEYHEDVKKYISNNEPFIDVIPDAKVGTVLSDDNSTYKVGPFDMSDFPRLKDYETTNEPMPAGTVIYRISETEWRNLGTSERSQYQKVGNEYVLKTDAAINGIADNLQEIVYKSKNSFPEDNNIKHYIGDIIKVEAVVTNEAGQLKTIVLNDAIDSIDYAGNRIPSPNEEDMYINLLGSDIEGFDELKTLKYTYRHIHSYGSGTLYKGVQWYLQYKENKNEHGCTSYEADNSKSYTFYHTVDGTTYSQSYTADFDYTRTASSADNNHCGGSHGFKDSSGDACTTTYSTDSEYCTGHDYGQNGCPGYIHTHGSGCDSDDCSHECGEACKDGCVHEHSSACCSLTEHSSHSSSCVFCDGCESFDTEAYAKDVHGGSLMYLCDHDYEWCRKVAMTDDKISASDQCQDGNCVRGELYYEDHTFEIEVDVPLKTQMEIYKYISEAKHVGELGQVFPSRDSDKYPLTGRTAAQRREMTADAKLANPVPVDRGDYVTYTIELVNDSRFPTLVKVEDLLPTTNGNAVRVEELDEDHSFKVIYSGGTQPAKDIEVGPHSKKIYHIIVRPNKGEGTYTNTAKFITMNHTAEKMRYTTWGAGSVHGAHTLGNIVNYYELVEGKRMQDSDTYIIKQYHVGVDKYIHDVSHDEHNLTIEGLEDNTFGPSDERTRELDKFTEEKKEANPVYAEFGDKVEYYIKIYNTNNKLVGNLDRYEPPYYNPDVVYVDIDDELPKKFSHMEIEIDNQESNTPSYTNPVQSTNGGKIEFRDVRVPMNGVTTITIRMIVEEHEKATIERNYVKFVNEIRNINYTDGHINDDEMNAINNLADGKYVESKEYYIIDNYNVFMEKFVSNYDELVTYENNAANFTAEDYLTTGDDHALIESRDSGTSPAGPNEAVTEEQKPAGYNRTPLTDQVRSITPKEEFKKNYPLGVEQREHITYTIKVTNDAKDVSAPEASGKKYATQARVEEIVDMMQVGITQENVSAIIVDASGNKVSGVRGDVAISIGDNGIVSEDGVQYHKYSYTTPENAILNPGESLIIKVECVIDQSNYYLLSLRNKAYFNNITNINHYSGNDRHVQKDDEYSENIAKQIETSEYIRMKDLVIAGKVWLDYNKDGLINDTGITDEMKQWYNISSSATNGEKQDIPVKLYRVVNGKGELLRTTKTDAGGLYTFGRDQLLNYYSSEYNYDGATGNHKYDGSLTYQRIPKCDPASYKDAYGNYLPSAKYQDYYIEYEYDGVIYKSTVEYANQDNLNKENGDLANDNYKIDSNAYEFRDVRDEFNTKYEYISYNTSYDINKANPSTMIYDKEGHRSELIEDSTRAMKSRSFIKAKDLDESIENTDLLWLYKKAEPGDDLIPYTEHLKYINLGLELREDVDIALVKDVYKVKTTVNGDEMEYSYNQVDGINGDMVVNDESGRYLNNYIIKEPYGLEIYDEDYVYRYDQYLADAVKAYKTQNSELNIEVTYRLSIHNRPTKDDERVPIGQGRDTKLDVKVSEIMDLYDENFIKFKGNATDDTIKVMVNEFNAADGENQLVEKPLKVAEAWYFKEGAPGEKYRLSTNNNGSDLKIYEPDPSGTYGKVELTLSNTSLYSPRTDMQEKATAQGYNTLYITGMENELIHEGEQLDIFVKYVVDKDKLEVENKNERFFENAKETASLDIQVNGTSWNASMTVDGSSEVRYFLERSLKLFERIDNGETERFLEGIGQVDMYSVWYANDESNGYFAGKPASLVDRDSNPGNIGLGDIDAGWVNGSPTYINPTSPEAAMTTIEDISKYDDTAYKTGINIYADILKSGSYGTTYSDYVHDGGDETIIRKLNGKVWDDARSEMVGDNIQEYQYAGNGKFSEEDTVLMDANGNPIPKINDNVPLNYDNAAAWDKNTTPVDEKEDILVRNAKVELVEIVPIKVGNEYHYYEEVKANQVADVVQNIRTDEKGAYELRGFTPGKYIVRYTYGDTVDPNIRNYKTTIGQVQEDMVVFNGQDYKSTQYNSVLDSITDPDEIILGLEQPNVSDARDDEIRRLDVISYSEVMNNRIAEVLKGSAVRAPESATEIALADTIRDRFRQAIGGSIDPLRYGILSPQTPALEGTELTNLYDELTNNTYMTAETVEFTVRTEKLLENQIGDYDERKQMSIGYNNITVEAAEQLYNGFKDMLIKHIPARNYVINNIDFGIEYRPEAEISLVKEVSEVKIMTSSRVDKTNNDNVLVDLIFLTREPTDGGRVVHYLDEVNSKGLELLQFISNTYEDNKILENLVVANENVQGLIYIQLDDDILQGSTVEITYKFFAENDSEIDRISRNYNAIRYRNNAATRQLVEEYGNDITMTVVSGALTEGQVTSPDYRASGTAANVLRRVFYNTDENSSIFRNSRKMMVATATGNDLDFSTGYFGRYLGAVYYKGKGQTELPNVASTGGNNGLLVNVEDGYEGYDVINPLKFTKIIDYVDTGLEYVQDTSVTDELIDRNWYRVTEEQLVEYIYELREQRKNGVADADLRLLDPDGIRYRPVLTVDDRQQDPVNGDFENETPRVTNNSLSRFLLPDITIEQNHTRTDTMPKYPHYEDKFDMLTGSTAEINLPVSKVIASETDTEDMVYENLAEVIEFISLTGRRTNFAATIGNASIQETLRKFTSTQIRQFGTAEFFTAKLEADQASVETITLTPPTGLYRFNKPSIISPDNPVQTSINIALIIAAVAVIGIGGSKVATTLYSKRRIK